MQPALKTYPKTNEEDVIINKEEKTGEASFRLFLNMPFFDTREKKPNFFIKIFSLFNEDVTKPCKKVSQNVESIFITTFGFETETFEPLLTSSKVKLIVLN